MFRRFAHEVPQAQHQSHPSPFQFPAVPMPLRWTLCLLKSIGKFLRLSGELTTIGEMLWRILRLGFMFGSPSIVVRQVSFDFAGVYVAMQVSPLFASLHKDLHRIVNKTSIRRVHDITFYPFECFHRNEGPTCLLDPDMSLTGRSRPRKGRHRHQPRFLTAEATTPRWVSERQNDSSVS